MDAFFNARRAFSSTDPMLAALCERLSEYCSRLTPWMSNRVARSHLSLLRLPEPSLWLETMEQDPQLVPLICGALYCANMCEWNPLQGGAEASDAIANVGTLLRAQVVRFLSEHASLAASCAGFDIALLLCSLGWSESSGPLAGALARGVLAAKCPITADLPSSFVSWAISLRSLDELTLAYVRDALSSGAACDVFRSSSGPLMGHLVRLLATSRGPELDRVLSAIDELLQGSDGRHCATIFVAKGLGATIVSALEAESSWQKSFTVVTRIVIALLSSGDVGLGDTVRIVDAMGKCMSHLTMDESLLAWFNTMCVAFGSTFSRDQTLLDAVCPRWSPLVTLECSSDGLLAAQLQLAGLVIRSWDEQLFSICCTLLTKSENPYILMTALFALGRTVSHRKATDWSTPDEEEQLHEVWLALLALLLAPLESLRAAAASCCQTLLLNASAAKSSWLCSRSWTWYMQRLMCEDICTSSSAVPRSAVHFLTATLDDGRALSESWTPDLSLRLIQEAAACSAPNDSLFMELLCKASSCIEFSRFYGDHQLANQNTQEALLRLVRSKLHEMSSSAQMLQPAASETTFDHSTAAMVVTGLHGEEYDGAILFPELLWTVSNPSIWSSGRGREDRLIRLRDCVKKAAKEQ